MPARPVTTSQMRDEERYAIDVLGIPALLLMDHAGRAVASEVREILGAKNKRVTAICGGGHNGGDGIVAARWLRGWGIETRVLWLKDPSEWKGSAALHAAIARRAGVRFHRFRPRSILQSSGVLIDAVLGTGFSGPARPDALAAIRAINASQRPIVAVDIPSGLNADTGLPEPEAVRASATVTFHLPKRGLARAGAKPYVGRLCVADIGLPYRR